MLPTRTKKDVTLKNFKLCTNLSPSIRLQSASVYSNNCLIDLEISNDVIGPALDSM